jgi:HEAT repeat protein
MASPQELAELFGRTLELFRDPSAKEEQKAQFRLIVAMLKVDGLSFGTEDGRLIANGVPLLDGGGPCDTLAQRLELHSVDRIAIPPDPPVNEVFELLRALAAPPSDDDIATRVKAVGAGRIDIAMQRFETPPPAPAPVTQKPQVSPPAAVPAHAPTKSPASDPSLADVPPIVQEAMAGGAGGFSPATAATRAYKDLLADLIETPSGPNAGDLLAVLGRQLETAMKTHRTEQALAIVTGIMKAEQQVSDATRRRQYSIALKRMYNKSLLEAVAELASAPIHREEALQVLRRAGEDGVEVLLDLLIAAPTIEERRGIFIALTGMKEGTDQLVHMLGHHQWFVVRNVAELAGELGLEEAVPALGQQLDNDDERVRKAVAMALAKIGSGAAAEHLRRALRDKSPEVRMHAAIGVGGRKSNALAMPLVVAMDEEEDENVERELMMALGRIGSAAAVQALIKFAQPGGRLFGRRPAALRVIAVEALRVAATPAAVGTLEGLTDDGDKQVRLAAEAALTDLKTKK